MGGGGVMHKSRYAWLSQELPDPFDIPHFVAPQVLRDHLNPAK